MENLIALAVAAMFYSLGVLSKDEIANLLGNWNSRIHSTRQMLEQAQCKNQEMQEELEFLRRLVNVDTNISPEDKNKLSQIVRKHKN